jgi:hypothetical protein
MCSNCSGSYEDPEMTQDPERLTPEQEACNNGAHCELDWDGYRGVFKCRECGAQLVLPELAEALGYIPTE